MLHGYWHRTRRVGCAPDVQFLCKLASVQVLVLRGVSCVTSYGSPCRLDSSRLDPRRAWFRIQATSASSSCSSFSPRLLFDPLAPSVAALPSPVPLLSRPAPRSSWYFHPTDRPIRAPSPYLATLFRPRLSKYKRLCRI